MFPILDRVFGKWGRWVLLCLVLASSVHFLLHLLLVLSNDPHGRSLKENFIDSGYGFFSYEVTDEICSNSELTVAPSAVLQQAHELLLQHKKLSRVLQGKEEGQAPLSLLSVHWVVRFAQLNPQRRQNLVKQLRHLEESLSSTDTQSLSSPKLQEALELELSPELKSSLLIYIKCKNKNGRSVYEEQAEAGGDGPKEFSVEAHKEALHEEDRQGGPLTVSQGSLLLHSLGVKTQMFLPSRFLGDPNRICQDFDTHLNEKGREKVQYLKKLICSPSLETVLQLMPLRLQHWWGRVRWQYHMAEYLRKLLTVFWPLNPYMHAFYRQDMFAFLSLMSPYLELEPPVKIDPNCRPPPAYWVVPLTQQQWEERQKQKKLSHKKQDALQDMCSANAAEQGSCVQQQQQQQGQKHQQQQQRQQQPPSNVFSIPEEHDNYVLIDEYCKQAREVHKGFFTGKPRKKPIKIVDTVILGYDLDLLEVRFHELHHTVDYFVVSEAHHHTLGVYQKPLFFSRNKERYRLFLDKVVHLAQPYDASLPVAQKCSEGLLKLNKDACWEYELFQRDSLLHMIAQVNAGTQNYGNTHIPKGFLDDETLIIASDVDEIPMGDRLRHLKFCEPVPQQQFGWVLVHYPGRVDAMALKDFKVHSGIKQTKYPHAIGPLADTIPYKSLRHLETKADFVYDRHAYTRKGPSELSPQLYLHGGWHLSDTSYLPYLFAKIPSDDIKPGYEPFNLYLPLLSQRGFSSSPVGGMLQSQVAAWRHFRDYRQVGSLCVEAKDVPPQYEEIGFGLMPWVMRCNPKRYPTWFQQPDHRYSLRPTTSFVVYGQSVEASSLEEWFAIFKFLRNTFSADITSHKPNKLTHP